MSQTDTQFRLLEPSQEGRGYDLVPGRTLTIGRDPEADVPLADARASRRHAEIRWSDGAPELFDLGSSNGTNVNGKPVFGSFLLSDGDSVEIGSTRLVFRDGATARPAPVAPRPSDAGSARRSRATNRRSAPWMLAGGGAVVAVFALLFAMRGGDKPQPKDGTGTVDVAEADVETLAPTELLPVVPAPTPESPEIRLERLLTASRFLDAMALVRDQGSPAHLQDRLERHLDHQAQVVLEGLDSRSAREGPAAIAKALRSSIDLFPRGTRAHGKLTDRLLALPTPEVAKVAAHEATNGGGTHAGTGAGATAAATEKPDPGADALVAEAETALKAGRLGEAESALGRLDAEPRSKSVRRQSDRLRRSLGSFQGLIGALASAGAPKGAATKVPLAADGSQLATLEEISDEGIRVQRGNATEWIAWRVLPASTWKCLTQKVTLAGQDLVHAGRVLSYLGDRESAEALATRASGAKSCDAALVQRLVADIRGMPDVPDGGFVLREGAWLSPSELARLELAVKIDRLSETVATKTGEVRDDAIAELLRIGDPARSKLHRALLVARADTLVRIRAGKGFANLAKIAELRASLDDLRTQALAIIFDESRYPYPYRPPAATAEQFASYQEAQREIDALVRSIEGVWKDKTKAQIPATLREEVRNLLDLDARIEEAAFGAVPESEDWFLHLPEGTDLTVQNIAVSLKDRERIDASLRVLSENENDPASASPSEQEQARITNRYRLMMGRHALRLHAKLVRAAHGHSEDMSRLGFFSHTSVVPGKVTMSDRVAKEDMEPIGLSENIAVSRSPMGAHTGWVHSSGHHRNILDPSWRIVGIGHMGDRYTQNFSIAERVSGGEEQDR